MSRQTELLHKAADALDEGRDPLTPTFLNAGKITMEELHVMAWILEHPRLASAALSGATVEELIMTVGKSGWGQTR